MTPAPTGLCATHQALAVAVCHRCGAFICAACVQEVDAHRYCSACAARPEVDYVEAYRLAHWGRRDGWAWFLGLGGVVNAVLGLGSAVSALSSPPDSASFGDQARGSLLMLASAVVGVAWFLRQRWARPGLGVLFVLQVMVLLISVGAASVAMAPALLLQTAVVYSAVTSPRSRMFFKLDVPRERLKRDWAVYHDNRAARSALVLGVSGLVVPGFGLLAVVVGAYALRRVDPNAHPPIGGRRAALAAMVTGVVATLLWVGLFVYSRIR